MAVTNPKPRAPQHVIAQLRAVIRTVARGPQGFRGDEARIPERIRPWLDSYSLDPLLDLLAWAEGRDGRVSDGFDRKVVFQRFSTREQDDALVSSLLGEAR